MKLTNNQALDLLTALRQMDSYERVAKLADGERIVREFYQLGVARLDIAKAMNALKPVSDAIETARRGLIDEINGGRSITPADGEKFDAFIKAMNVILEQEATEVKVTPIKRDALRLDVNPIPVAVLATLGECGLIED